MIIKAMDNEYGSVVYTDNALINIIGINTLEVPGVSAIATKNAVDGMIKKMVGQEVVKGITISEDKGAVSINIPIIIDYGVNFTVVATNIISKVKHDIEALTELNVVNIVVTIQEVKAGDK